MSVLLLVAALLYPGQVVTSAAPTRWAIEVRGPATVERGELRLNGSDAQLLMESADTAYVVLRDVTVGGGRIAFTSPAGNRRFEGVVAGDEIRGTVHEDDGRIVPWRAEVIQAGIQRWPVRPRVVVRQLVVGSPSSTTTIAASWRAAAPASQTIIDEYDALARRAGLKGATGIDLLRRTPMLTLGFDRESRAVARAMLDAIAATPAADGEFTRIFRGSGGLRLDIHEVAVQAARIRMPQFRLDAAARAYAALQLMPQGSTDTLAIYEAAWRLWSRAGRDSLAILRVVDSLTPTDAAAWRSARVLLAGYDDAAAWWATAVRWLMTHAWMPRADGTLVSPDALVAAFWGRNHLPLPIIEPTRFSSVQAVPVLGGARLGVRLLRPGNASATEWLVTGGIPLSLDVWRTLDADDSMMLDAGGELSRITAPAAVARGRLGGFLAGRDAIRIEPGIIPVLAVATLVHEWQHLLFEGGRLEGPAWGLRDNGRELRIIEADPWVGEGAAEWATEVTLTPIHERLPLLAFMEAEKRSGIALASEDDPHVLGYLLVRAIAERAGDVPGVRDRLLRLLDDPVKLAAESGFRSVPGAVPLVLARPATQAIIPEITFTWDDGIAESVQRRLLVSPTDRIR